MSKGHFILYNSNEKNFTSMGALVLDNYIIYNFIKYKKKVKKNKEKI